MGLSASQARLLSITRRLNNNELESEIIAMQKMHLSDRNTQACNNYINALDATKFEYISYNDTAIQESVSLTFNAINQYSSLKNQYALFNNENQIYVSATDAANFEKSTYLHDFLDCYGLFDQGRAEYEAEKQAYEKEMEQYEKDKKAFDEAYSNYSSEFSDYSTALDEYNEKLAEYNEKLKAYEEALNTPDLYAKFSNAVGTSEELLAIPSTSDDLPEGLSKTKGCYWSALHPDGTPNRASCYTHVLGHLIDFTGNGGGEAGPYTTTAGDTVTCNTAGGYMAGGADYHTDCVPLMIEISEGINELDEDGNYKRICDGTDDYRGTTGVTNALAKALQDYDAGTIDATELKMWQLISDFYVVKDSDGNYVLDADGNYTYGTKSLKQKAIDLMYLSKNWAYSDSASGEFSHSMLTDDMMVDILINFTDGDLRNLTLDPPGDPPTFDEEMPTFDLVAPQEPVAPQNILKIYDKALAQWYTNLFYIMDGQSVSDEIGTIYDENANFDYFKVADAEKTCKNSSNYIVIDNQSAGDSSWLKFALENGLVHLQIAGLKTEINGTRMTWEGIELSSTSDMVEVEDSTKIAKAEAEYKSSLAQIEAEDKQFDVEMSKLDSEHSSFEKEIESIKTVMEKNVEKSFNAFS